MYIVVAVLSFAVTLNKVIATNESAKISANGFGAGINKLMTQIIVKTNNVQTKLGSNTIVIIGKSTVLPIWIILALIANKHAFAINKSDR